MDTDPATIDLAWSDEELTALALAADPDAPLDPGAVPFSSVPFGAAGADEFPTLLPAWYMPVPSSHTGSRRRAVVVAVVIVSLLVLNALGMCITSGFLEVP